MAPHSSTLAWKIPWTEEPGRLQSVGLLRVGHNWTTSLSLFSFMHWRRKWQPTPVFLPGESQGQRSLVGCNLWGHTELDRLKWFSSSSSKRARRNLWKWWVCSWHWLYWWACVCTYICHTFVHSSVNEHFSHFQFLGIIECAAGNNGMHASFLLSSFKAYLPDTLS